jgi:hypothetical protein
MHGWLVTVIVVVLVALAIASFFVRRHGEADAAQPGWQRTDEVFKDPGTSRTMRVWIDRDGGRHYVPER